MSGCQIARLGYCILRSTGANHIEELSMELHRRVPDGQAVPLTDSEEYCARLERLENQSWKRWLGVQVPYRWNIRRVTRAPGGRPGFVLDVGCGLGRNLVHLGGHGVGIDHNPHAVARARARGVEAFTPEEFERSDHADGQPFDVLLLAHVLEHLDEQQGVTLVRRFSRYVRPGGRLVIITPQEAGQRSDPTHVRFVDFEAAARMAAAAGFRVVSFASFPLPRVLGRVFPYNEFVVRAERLDGS